MGEREPAFRLQTIREGVLRHGDVDFDSGKRMRVEREMCHWERDKSTVTKEEQKGGARH